MESTPQDQSEEWVNIRFERRQLRVRKGKPLAAVLLTHGIRVLGRSFKFHRPRGYYCGRGYCNNCALTVDGLPNVLSCEHRVSGGETVWRERGWPSARFDVFGVLGLFERWLRPGFQGKLFPGHPALAGAALRLVSRMAGGNRLPTESAAKRQIRVAVARHADVLVVGGGLSGCLAALGAASVGASVLLVQRGPLGGRRLLDESATLTDDAACGNGRNIRSVIDEVRRSRFIDVIDGTAIGYFEDQVIPVVTGAQLLECHAKKLIVATGSYDVPALFRGNDKPNVILGDGVLQLVAGHGIVPWQRAAVLTDCARGYRLAALLRRHGVDVVSVVDQSEPGQRDAAHQKEAAATSGAVNGRVLSAGGFDRVRRVDIETAQGRLQHRVDLVCIALMPHPADALRQQWDRVHFDGRARESNGVALHESAASGTVLAIVGSAAAWPDLRTESTAFDAGKEVAAASNENE